MNATYAGTHRVVLDDKKRLTIPAENLLLAAGIDSNRAWLIGKLDCFEIWDPGRFEARPVVFRKPEDIAF